MNKKYFCLYIYLALGHILYFYCSICCFANTLPSPWVSGCLIEVLESMHIPPTDGKTGFDLIVPDLVELISEKIPGSNIIAKINKKTFVKQQKESTCNLHARLCSIESLYDEQLSPAYSYLSLAFEYTRDLLQSPPYRNIETFSSTTFANKSIREQTMLNRDGVLSHSNWPKNITRQDIITAYYDALDTFIQPRSKYGIMATEDNRFFISAQGNNITYFDNFAKLEELNKVGLPAQLERNPKEYLVAGKTVYKKHHIKLEGKDTIITKKVIIHQKGERPPLMILLSKENIYTLGLTKNSNKLEILSQFERRKIPPKDALKKLNEYGYNFKFKEDGKLKYTEYMGTPIKNSEINSKQNFDIYRADFVFNSILEKFYAKLKNINKHVKNKKIQFVSHFTANLKPDELSSIVKDALDNNKIVKLDIEDYKINETQIKPVKKDNIMRAEGSKYQFKKRPGHSVSIIAMISIDEKRFYVVSDSSFTTYPNNASSPIKIIFEEDIYKMPESKISYAEFSPPEQ